jgi:hypothetical protein
LAEAKADDPEGRTYAEVIAANLIAIACSQGSGAVTAMRVKKLRSPTSRENLGQNQMPS